MKVHYCWFVSFACILVTFICVGLVTNGFSMYLPYIEEQGISDSQLSMIVNVRGGISLVMMFVTHRFYQKFSPRLGIFIACLLTFAAYAIYGFAGSNLYLYFFGSALAGMSYGLGSMIIVAEVLRRWFHSHFNLSIGLAAAGTGIATVIMPYAVNMMVDAFGLSLAFIVEAGIIFLLSAIAFIIIRNHPEEKGTHALGQDEQAEDTFEQVYVKAELPRKTWLVFASICFVMGCIGGPGLVFISMLFDCSGMDVAEIALCISIIGILMTISKVIIGRIIDKIGTYKALMLFGAVLLIGLFMSPLLHNTGFIRIFSVFMLGVGFSMMMVSPASFSKDIAKEGQYFSTVRILEIAYVTGSFVFAIVPGFLASFTGTYVTSYLLLGVMLAVSMILMSAFYLGHRGRPYSEP